MEPVDTQKGRTITEKEIHTAEQVPHSQHRETHENSAPLEHEKTHDHNSEEHDKDYHLKKENTLGVDVDNEFAVKGDDSDGEIT